MSTKTSRTGFLLFTILAGACAPITITTLEPPTAGSWASSSERLGARVQGNGDITFRVFSERAERVEVWLYRASLNVAEVARLTMMRDDSHIWSADLSAGDVRQLFGRRPVLYGLRAWGPNWRHTTSWTPGSEEGFVEDVDDRGNRFNPNKLLVDPYALEITHDPIAESHLNAGIDARIYASGDGTRAADSAPWAPKSIAIATTTAASHVTHPLAQDIIYEVHVRGLTMNDPSVPIHLRGTYAGAALKAATLARLGITAVEFLPVQETQNDTNDLVTSTEGDNYWGYATLAFFAPDRRYAADQSPGGPTQEFQHMVDAFHAVNIKVFIDVVYNHTGEGGIWDAGVGNVATLLSWRGLDNHSYYQDVHGDYDPNDPDVVVDHRNYWDNNGVAGNFRTAHPAVRTQIVDSLVYWHQSLGVDGFRFDLASVLGNECGNGCFEFDKMNPENALNRAARELPARGAGGGAGVDLIAEPWAIGAGTYQIGNFPWGWAEWNDHFREVLRKDQNKMGIEPVTPGQIATRVAGSSDLFEDDGRAPWQSINFLVSHDGFTLKDLYSCNEKNNNQSWPYGPSDGGENNNNAWDHGGDSAAQRQAARTGMALLMMSVGTPMMTGGDEFLRSQGCNNNAYNLDSVGNWMDWRASGQNDSFQAFTRKLISLRRAHRSIMRQAFFDGLDHDNDGPADITWLTDAGVVASGSYMDAPDRHFLAWRIDADESGDAARSIYVAYNGWDGLVSATLPSLAPGRRWHRAVDTASWMEAADNARELGTSDPVDGNYVMAPRSLVVLLER